MKNTKSAARAVCLFLALLMVLGFIVSSAISAFAAAKTPAKLTKSDLYLTVGKKTLKLGHTTSQMEKVLGEDYEMSSEPSCLFDGEDRIYEYEGITVYTHPSGKKNIVEEIYITSDDYETKRGIKVGSSFSDVAAAYGTKYEKVSSSTIEYYYSKSMKLIFEFEDKKVVAIDLYNVPIEA